MKKEALKIFSLLLMMFTLITQASAQNSKYKLAERYYQEYNYGDAAKIYDDILKKNKDDVMALRKSAECHEKLGNLPKAEKQLSRLITLEESSGDDMLKYAHVLKKNKKYKEAIEVYNMYSEKNPDETWVKGYLDDENWTHKILRDSSQFVISNSAMNTKWKEFAPGFVNGDLTFSSSRPEGASKKNTSGESYLNVFKTKIDEEGNLKGVEEFKAANSKYHESNVVYDSNSQMIYFTRNHYYDGKKDKSSSGKLKLAIYYAPYSGGSVGKIQPFAHNNPEYSVGQAAFSDDGQYMVFVSDQPGGIGGTDLYYCEKEAEGWGTPINFGPEINTPGNEMSPFMMGNDKLYFASDGHPGLGGLDIFSIRPFQDGSKAKNLGYPVNTAYDDFGFILKEDGKTGFQSSNRPGGKGQDDIYNVSIKSPDKVVISGIAIDTETGEPIPNTSIQLKSSDGTEMTEVIATTDENGEFMAEVDFRDAFVLVGAKNGYFKKEMELESDAYSKFIEGVEIELMKFDYAAEGLVIDVESGLPIEAATVSLLDQSGKLVKSLETGMDGKILFRSICR